jgi:hypothetical protein
MTLPRGFLGGVRGDGLADERRGADAARSAAGSGSKTIDDRGGGAIDHPDGRLSIRYNGVDLAYRTFDKIRHVDQGAIADNKRLVG